MEQYIIMARREGDLV